MACPQDLVRLGSFLKTRSGGVAARLGASVKMSKKIYRRSSKENKDIELKDMLYALNTC